MLQTSLYAFVASEGLFFTIKYCVAFLIIFFSPAFGCNNVYYNTSENTGYYRCLLLPRFYEIV